MTAAHLHHHTAAPPAAPPRAAGWRDRLRARRARRRGVSVEGHVTIGRDVRFELSEGARLVLGDGAVLGDGCRLHVSAGEVRLGAGAVLGERCVIAAHGGVSVGERCLLGDEVVLVDFDHRFDDVERPVRLQGVDAAPIAVGDAARIGPGTAVLRGVTIGAGAVVGAHAVVTRDVPAGAVVEGAPAATPARPARPPAPPAGGARASR